MARTREAIELVLEEYGEPAEPLDVQVVPVKGSHHLILDQDLASENAPVTV